MQYPTPNFRSSGLTLLEALFAVVIAVIFTSISVKVLISEFTRDSDELRSRNLSNAKQIYLGLLMYAGDHNGAFPNQNTNGSLLRNANEAYRQLIPNYAPRESIFYSRYSRWTPKEPDEQIGEGKTLVAGENHWAYVSNLTEDSNKSSPLIATGFEKDKPGTYGANRKLPIIVIRADGSGKQEVISKEDSRIYGDDGTGKTIDLFKPAPGWLRRDQAPLNPEG